MLWLVTPRGKKMAAFTAAKEALAAAIPLVHPDPATHISLATDASDTHVEGVLQQWQDGSWAPLSFFSAKLALLQQRYSTFDWELLAASPLSDIFCFFLEGRQFTLFTDHKALLAALYRVSLAWTARQQWQLAYLAEFASEICHTLGVNNAVADALSRPPSVPEGPSSQSGTVERDQQHMAEADGCFMAAE